ncbi:30S ribosomal protein S1 [Wolbachia endosymbiont of Dirofilaria (Dirofilaria) immitis]|uniref:30S ribosomal protein S1 n=1 Tax=Wolbachia endosymbiont of Dirofilaria (Dirofilaria) immitis TaxID=1812115 RepID=UPI00158DBE75|nr:30S ribosomal protein S1 [Wolbachia endosymbiont of Dirofilaria (Dirofilaria) immitis]QKX02568.1 30S ribosomal protein S1 [Wolbachia endosymbiont of Dirofilaria (Dirofilaria) immitis]
MSSSDLAINLPISIKRLSSNRFIEEVYQDQFEDQGNILFEDSFIKKIKEGDIVEGIITRINPNDIVVDVGLKSDGRIPIKELGCNDEIAVGSKIRVYVERIEDYHGNVALSREKAIRDEKWHKLEEDAATQTEVSGIIKRSIKCGFIVDLGDGISAFLPLSHVDLKQIKDVKHLIDAEQKFIVLKVDRKQGNIVVSRKLVLEKLHAGEKIKFLESLNEGDIIEGKIKSITHYGVFVGIHESDVVGVVDGLLHITDISWSRVSHPSAVFTCGQSIKVKVIKIDKENAKVSLGIKQLEDNPWHDIELKYPIDGVYKGHVTSIEDYGVFVELKPGIEGLVHSSEITWIKNNLPVSNLVTRGQEVSVKILSIDTIKNRMSLSMKRCVNNPWQVFIDKYPPGSIVSGKIKNNTGLYISVTFDDYEIDGNIEGTVYAQDISWSKNGLDQIKKYNVGDIIEAKVIRANVDRARIYLGIKQIEYDPLIELIKKVKVGNKMQAIVSKREDSGLVVEVENGLALLIDQKHLPENKKFSISEKIEVEVLDVEVYNIILSAK